MSSSEVFMKNKTKILVVTIPLTLLVSCSNLESFDSKMSRYKSRDVESNKVPTLYPLNFNTNGRTIASESDTPSTPPEALENATVFEKTITNKKLYFQSLYEQYAELSSFIPEKQNPKIDSCPQFHGNFLEYKKTSVKDQSQNFVFSYDREKFTDSEYLAKHPELLLSVVEDDSLPRAVDLLMKKPDMVKSEQSDIVKNALALHMKRTYSELRELCEYGVSQNYYIFENLMTHAKGAGIASNTEGVKVLLKTTLFSNLAIKTSLTQFKEASPSQGRMPASAIHTEDNKEKEVMKRLNVTWMKDYFQKMRE